MFQAIARRIGFVQKHSDVLLAIAVISMVLLLIIPLPPVMIDGLLSISIVLAVVTLLITIYTDDSLNFSSFPSLLLFLTIYRLGLNIASTRLILSEGQAGDIINTFGQFVSAGNIVIGLIIFILLTVINFVVITKGSGRVAEVAARFTLDAMPGKQMSIDADLNAGIIDDKEARERRERIAQEADFYGAMDGASKFVRGDAIAGIVITVVNIIGGLTIGMVSNGMSWDDAVSTYTILAIGDGLVSQIPALLISVGAGIIVTRASSQSNLSSLFQKQVFSNPRVLFITSLVILILGFVPGMPLAIMFVVSFAISSYAYVIWKSSQEGMGELSNLSKQSDKDDEKEMKSTSDNSPGEIEEALFVDTLEIELGYGLIPLVDQSQGGDLLGRITVIRRQIASELGIVLPSIRIRDNMALDAIKYVIKIRGIEVAGGKLHLDSYLAMNPGHIEKEIPGIKTTEPAFGLPAVWISSAHKEQAEVLGYTVVDTLSVLATHLTEIIHVHAFEIINRQETSRLVDNAKEYASAVIEELIPNQLTLGQILKVLQNLLRERVSIRDFVTILETLADYSHNMEVKDTEILTEFVRQSLSRSITKQYMDEKKSLYAMTIDSRVEQMIGESVQTSEFGANIVIRPATINKIIEQVSTNLEKASDEGKQLIILTSPQIRRFVKQIIERDLPRIPIVSYKEISKEASIESIGVISNEVLV